MSEPIKKDEPAAEVTAPSEQRVHPEASAPDVGVSPEARAVFEREKRTGAFRAVDAVRRAGFSETEVRALAQEMAAEKIASGDLMVGWRLLKTLQAGTDAEWRAVGALAFTHTQFADPGSARSIARELWGPESEQINALDAESDRLRGKARVAPPKSDPVFDPAFVDGLRAVIVRLVGAEHEILRAFEANIASAREEMAGTVVWSEAAPPEVDLAVEDVEPMVLASDATFADLFAAIDAAGEAMEEVFFAELQDHFDGDLVEAMVSMQTDATLASMSRVVDFFKARGVSQRDLTAFLPMRFSRRRST
jgi:hypothetical protein